MLPEQTSVKDHRIAGYGFLILMVGLIGWGSSQAIARSKNALNREQIRAAVERGKRGEFDPAEELLREVLRRMPDHPDALLNLGIVQAALEQDDEADRTFSRLLELYPDDYDAIAERAGILKRRGKVEEAFAMLEKIPLHEGHVKERLETDPLWADLRGDERLLALLQKHGGSVEPTETTLRPIQPDE